MCAYIFTYLYAYIYSSFSQTLSLPNSWPLSPRLPSCWHLDIRSAKLQPYSSWLYRVSDVQMAVTSQVPPGLLPLEIHTQSWPLETHSPPSLPGHFTYSLPGPA